MKEPKLIRDWAGGFVKSKIEISNGWGSMPAGTVYKINASGITAHLSSALCGCCGFSFRVTLSGRDKFENFNWLGYGNPSEL